MQYSLALLTTDAGVEAEKVGADAANDLLQNLDHGGCVDEFLQDQVISTDLHIHWLA